MSLTKRKLLQVHLETTDYQIRTEEVRDTTYWVVPVVMMVEGVHHGSRGPLLYTQKELAASVSSWDGQPITIGHPQNDKGKYISANAPGVLKSIVGRVYNAKMKGDKLTAEAWIDVNALTQVSTEALEYIKEKKALDVSVGVFSEEEGDEGEFNGETYRAAATNITPDHLALLPGENGACSWNDGCGIRNNSKNIMEDTSKPKPTLVVDKATCMQVLLDSCQGVHLIQNKASLNQIVSSVYDKLNAMDTDRQVHYVEEVYDSYVVYSEINRTGQSPERKMYKQDYSLSADGKIEFTGNRVEVKKKVSYVAIESSNNKSKTKVEMNTNSKPCTCTVDSLIANEATAFTEDDRQWLSALSQEQLNKLAPKETAPVAPAVNKAGEPEKKEESLVSKNADGSISINGKSIDQIIKETLAKETDPVKFIDNFMPDGLKDQMKTGLKMYQTRRETQIKEIAANSKFKPEQLKNWSDENLAALHETVVDKEEGNYTALTAGSRESDDEGGVDEITAMLSFATSKPAAKEPAK